jgi:hypothetical protein
MKTLFASLLFVLLFSSFAFADGEIIKTVPRSESFMGGMEVQKICINGMLFYRFKDNVNSSVVQVFIPVDNKVMTYAGSMGLSERNIIKTSVPARCE